MQKEYIENYILQKAREELTDENIAYISKVISEVSKRENNTPILAELKKQLKENAKAVDNLLKAIENGGDNIDIISERITKKRQEKTHLETALAREQFEKTEIDEDDIGVFLYRLKKGNENDIAYKRLLINMFINAVYLYDDKVTIFFNATDRPVEFEYNINDSADNTTENEGGEMCSYNQPHAPPRASSAEQFEEQKCPVKWARTPLGKLFLTAFY